MDLILKRPMSRRFFQLNFEGFRPGGRNKIEQFFLLWLKFIKTLLAYGVSKIKGLLYLLYLGLAYLVDSPNKIKNLLIRKLIWSRGRLGRPIASFFILSAAFGIFMLGEVFSSSSLIVNPPVSADYLATTTDIIPRREIALTTIPEVRQRSEALKYSVQSGENLYSIGAKFKVSVDALKYVNTLTDDAVLKIGQEIVVPPVAGLVHAVARGETLASIASKYEVPSQSIADFNYILDTSKLAVGTELIIPGAKVPVPIIPVIVDPTPYLPNSTGQAGSAKSNPDFCAWPSTVKRMSQGFYWGHTAIDVDTPPNGPMPPLLACTTGTVTRAGWDNWGLGLRVTIDHGNGFTTVYGHMSRIDVSVGEKVKRGEIIGLMGSTFAPPYGRSTGPHVHFIVNYNGVPQNPLNFTHM